MSLGYFVRKVSREGVIDGVKHVKRYYIPSKKLISNKNPLQLNCTKAIKKHADDRLHYTISSNSINSYLASSSLSHLLDGWMYLSDAFNALINGDEGTCIHLAYYAELRSAMSILASEGIGVFNKKHLGVFSKTSNGEYPKNYYKPTGGYVQPESATHQFVWDVIEKWTNSTLKPQADILKIFSVRGHDFYDLTQYFHPLATVLTTGDVVKQWLKEWCFDIKSYRSDREMRNEVSYRPQKIKNFDVNIDFKNIINCLNDFWTIISPLQRDRFSLLDTYLLRKLFNELYARIIPSQPLKELAENALNNIGLYDTTLVKVLSSEAPYNVEHIIFQEAIKKETTSLSIIARATLLLRVSIGLVSQLFSLGGVSQSDLNFVWKNYGDNNGFWDSGNMPSDFEDLWLSIQTPIQDLKNWINSGNPSLYSVKKNNPENIIYFTQINRGCLWGLAI